MNSLKGKTIAAFAAIYFIWGSTFFGVSIALKSFPPFLLSTLRFLIGGLALAVYCYIRKEQLPTAKEIMKLSFWGIVIFGGGVIAVVWAQQHLPSSLASIIITTPFWFIVLDKSQWRVNFGNAWIVAGLMAGLGGVILLLSQKASARFDAISIAQTKSILVMMGGSLLWVIGSLRLKARPSSASIYLKTSIHLLAASAFAFTVSALTGELSAFHIENIRTDSVVALLFVSILSTTMTFMAFVWLMKTKPVAMVSTYAYVNPMVAILLGVFIGRESVNALQVIAMLIILSGVLFVNIPNYKLKL